VPYCIFTGAESPQFKGDKKIVEFDYVEPANNARRLAASGLQVDVQGTSSQYYAVKNLKIKFKNGATMNGTAVIGFTIRDGAGAWHWADAKITGPDTVRVWAAGAKNPTAVRYNWGCQGFGNLYNAAGLPASCFTTED